MNLRRKLVRAKKKVDQKIYKKYVPTSEWFTLNRKSGAQGSDIKSAVNRLKDVYFFKQNSRLFTKDHHFKDFCYEEYIEIKEKFLPLLNHPFLLRLLDLKQLSLTYRLHISATHNRFSHSIGTYKRIGQLIEQLKKNDEIRDFLIKNEDILYIYALIHDIGHTPFSHSLEYIFQMKEKAILREILETNIELRNIIEDILEGTDYNYEDFLHIITIKDEDLDGKDVLLRKTIDSPIDADRMDWLNRDMRLCRGESITSRINHIIANTFPYKTEEGLWILVYRRDGRTITNLTEFLHLRHQMYIEVYEDPRKVILEELIARILHEIFTQNNISIDQLKYLTDEMVIVLITIFCDEKQDLLLKQAQFGNEYEMIETISVKESKNRGYNPWGVDCKGHLEKRAETEKIICEACNLTENYAFVIHFPREFISGIEDIWLIDEDDDSLHLLKNEHYFDELKKLDEENAPHIQLFLLKTNIDNFDAKREEVKKAFNDRVIEYTGDA